MSPRADCKAPEPLGGRKSRTPWTAAPPQPCLCDALIGNPLTPTAACRASPDPEHPGPTSLAPAGQLGRPEGSLREKSDCLGHSK